ncbi:DUF2243 domain-containing protein [Myxococcus sp. AM001]|uniref:DUF2243 domain-containing protein n=1 Tax=Myxococcus vastator TaxID=2709664 RepID=UPI0013D8CA5F|nr:DUF2243 domain-containing protein [Myxococcus vastator]NVJ06888.1 DUF2243 domain-containing protein [Myxococcus sp. AM001]
MSARNRGPLVLAGLLLGVGLGGFVDGILLHQILQWHHMLSTPLPPDDVVSIKVNMFWDGLFHALTWVVTLAGVWALWRAGQRSDVPWSTRTFAGAMLAGWGFFNVVEGILDHQLFDLHHVKPGPDQLAWDVGFLVFGALLITAGWALGRAGREDRVPRSGLRVPHPAH